jgi:hypothetical protein
LENFIPKKQLLFDTDDEGVVRGFELGRIWALLHVRPDEVVEEYVHAASLEMVLRMAEATSRGVREEELGDGWLLVRFEPRYRESEGTFGVSWAA